MANKQESKPRGKAAMKTFAPITGGFESEDVPTNEHVSFVLDTGRNDDQKQVDRDVVAAHTAWVNAGRPPFTRSTLSHANCPVPRKRYVVDPSATEAIDTYLTRAANLYGLAVVKAPVKRHEDGRAMIYWAVKDRPERNRTAAQADAEASAEADAVADQEG